MEKKVVSLMKQLQCAIALIAFVNVVSAQVNCSWSNGMGGLGGDYSQTVLLDYAENSYIVGAFQSVVDFDPDTSAVNLTSTGSLDAFVAKYSSNGALLWAHKFGQSGIDYCLSATLDNNGNIYFTGYYSGTVDFDPGPGTFFLYPGPAGNMFVAKLDPLGQFIWAKSVSGSGTVMGRAIHWDESGNIYVGGTYSGLADFDPSSSVFTLSSAGDSDIFILKLDPNGSYIWAKSIGGTTYEEVISLKTDVDENILFTGCFSNLADFDPGLSTYNLTSSGSYDSFVCKLDLSGNLIWVKKIDGTNIAGGSCLAVDGSGTSFITGHFSGIGDFDPSGTSAILTSAGGLDVFFWILDSSGNLVSAKSFGGVFSDAGNGIALDDAGNIYLTGGFSSVVDFDPGPAVENATSNGITDIYISKFDSLGTFLWSKTIGGYSPDHGVSVAVSSAAKNVYITGYFSATSDFDPNAGIENHTSGGNYDLFLLKLCQSQKAVVLYSGELLMCEGASIMFSTNTASEYLWNTNDTSQSIIANSSGPYFVTVTDDKGCSSISDTINLVVEECTSIRNSIALEATVNISPNPGSGIFQLSYLEDNASKLRVEVHNSTGQMVWSQNEQNSSKSFSRTIDLSAQPKGIYFVQVTGANTRMVRKLIIK